jgi:serine/threonine protein kinase
MKMLEPDPTKRITAEQCLKHEYLAPVRQSPLNEINDEFEENIVDDGDNSDLMNRINKINEE